MRSYQPDVLLDGATRTYEIVADEDSRARDHLFGSSRDIRRRPAQQQDKRCTKRWQQVITRQRHRFVCPIPFPTHNGADYCWNATQYEEDRPRVGNAGDSGGCGEEGKDVDRDACRCATGSEEEGRLKRGVADGFDEEWTEDCHAAIDLR